MALIKCSECGKEISDTARICPNCGYRKQLKMTKLDKIFIPLIVLFVTAGFFGIILSPGLVKYSYPNLKTYETRDSNGLIGYDSNGNEIRGHTSTTHYNLGEQEKDSSNCTIVIVLSILIPTATIITYRILKKKEC